MGLENILDIAESIGVNREKLGIAVQKKYATYVRKGRLGYLRSLQELTGIKPSEDVVQEGYATYVREGWLDDLRSLQELTGIKPDLSEEPATRYAA